MEGTRYRLTVVFMLLFAFPLCANTKRDIYNAYISNSMGIWKGIIDQLESKPGKGDVAYEELINYQYGYIGWCIGSNRKDEAEDYLKRAENNLKQLEKRGYSPSRINGYKSAFYGFHIGLSPFSAPFIGPKSSACAKKSVALDPEDFFGYIQIGNVQFHAPALVGGSKPEALKNYLKAKALMEKNNQEIPEDWNYLSLMTSIAKTYEEMNNKNQAKLIYEEILKAEPQFKWVRDELYPRFIKGKTK